MEKERPSETEIVTSRERRRVPMPDYVRDGLTEQLDRGITVDPEKTSQWLGSLWSPDFLNPLATLRGFEACTPPVPFGMEDEVPRDYASPLGMMNRFDLGLLRPQRQCEQIEAALRIFEEHYRSRLQNPQLIAAARLAIVTQEFTKAYTQAMHGTNAKIEVAKTSSRLFDQLFADHDDVPAVKLARLFIEDDPLAKTIYGRKDDAAITNQHMRAACLGQCPEFLDGSEGYVPFDDVLVAVWVPRSASHTQFGFYTNDKGMLVCTVNEDDRKKDQTLDSNFDMFHGGVIKPEIAHRGKLRSIAPNCSPKLAEIITDYIPYADLDGVWQREWLVEAGQPVLTIERLMAEMAHLSGMQHFPLNALVLDVLPEDITDPRNLPVSRLVWVRDPSPKWGRRPLAGAKHRFMTDLLQEALGLEVRENRTKEANRALGVRACIALVEAYQERKNPDALVIGDADEKLRSDLAALGAKADIAMALLVTSWPADSVARPRTGESWHEWAFHVSVDVTRVADEDLARVEQIVKDTSARLKQKRFFVETVEAVGAARRARTIAYAA